MCRSLLDLRPEKRTKEVCAVDENSQLRGDHAGRERVDAEGRGERTTGNRKGGRYLSLYEGVGGDQSNFCTNPFFGAFGRKQLFRFTCFWKKVPGRLGVCEFQSKEPPQDPGKEVS